MIPSKSKCSAREGGSLNSHSARNISLLDCIYSVANLEKDNKPVVKQTGKADGLEGGIRIAIGADFDTKMKM